MFPTAYFKRVWEFRPWLFLSPCTERLSPERIGRCKKTSRGLWKEGNEVMINCTQMKATRFFILVEKKATLLYLLNMSSAWVNKVSYFSENSFFGHQRVGLGALSVSDAKQQAKRVSANKEAAKIFHTFFLHITAPSLVCNSNRCRLTEFMGNKTKAKNARWKNLAASPHSCSKNCVFSFSVLLDNVQHLYIVF